MENEQKAKRHHNNNTILTEYTFGSDMEPLLHHRISKVKIEPVRKELSKGDLVLYKQISGNYVIHRIVGMDSFFYYVRGDNRSRKVAVSKEHVQGVVTAICRSKRVCPVTSMGYRLYTLLWNGIFPIRWLVYQFRHFF